MKSKEWRQSVFPFIQVDGWIQIVGKYEVFSRTRWFTNIVPILTMLINSLAYLFVSLNEEQIWVKKHGEWSRLMNLATLSWMKLVIGTLLWLINVVITERSRMSISFKQTYLGGVTELEESVSRVLNSKPIDDQVFCLGKIQ